MSPPNKNPRFGGNPNFWEGLMSLIKCKYKIRLSCNSYRNSRNYGSYIYPATEHNQPSPGYYQRHKSQLHSHNKHSKFWAPTNKSQIKKETFNIQRPRKIKGYSNATWNGFNEKINNKLIMKRNCSQSLKQNQASGKDGIPYKVLNMLPSKIIIQFNYIYNYCHFETILPAGMEKREESYRYWNLTRTQHCQKAIGQSRYWNYGEDPG